MQIKTQGPTFKPRVVVNSRNKMAFYMRSFSQTFLLLKEEFTLRKMYKSYLQG
jgi:hypothetical protein